MKRTRLRPVSKKNVTRTGKLGIVRLRGKDLAELRLACFIRDDCRCQICGDEVCLQEYGLYPRGEMAHIHAKRNGGDTIDNVRTLCPDCHRKSHNAGGKPCPPK